MYDLKDHPTLTASPFIAFFVLLNLEEVLLTFRQTAGHLKLLWCILFTGLLVWKQALFPLCFIP